MRRRDLLLAAAAPLSLGGPRQAPSGAVREPVAPGQESYSSILHAAEAAIPAVLERQDRRPGHRGHGGVVDTTGIHTASGTAGLVQSCASVYCARESTRFLDPVLLEPMEKAVSYLIGCQHADGTIDLPTTNFHSTPDTAFVIEPLAAARAVLAKADSSKAASLVDGLDRFLRRAGRALEVGGIHTPNHRWVVCAALARLHGLFGSPVDRIDEWLSEGIDIDADGQFTERSTAVYSPVTDRSLLTVARILDRPLLLEPVRRNLEMTLYYLHADGDVASEASRRQDQYTRGSTAGYHLPYRFMALQDSNGRFAAMTRWIEERHGASLAGNLIHFLEVPRLRNELPDSADLPSEFVRHFRHSDLVRYRRGPISATLLGGNAAFFSFHKGGAVLEAVRFASAFFGKGQFVGSGLQPSDGGFRLSQNLKGPYYQPLPTEARHRDGHWDERDKAKRPQSEVQQLRQTVTTTEKSGSFEIAIEVGGCDQVPVAIELAFRKVGRLVGVETLEGIPDAHILRGETGTYEAAGERIRFGPGRAEHRWTQLRGALPRIDALSVYITGYTPFRTKLTIS